MSEEKITACPNCGNAIPETAETCPSCGRAKTAGAAGQESETVMEAVEVAGDDENPVPNTASEDISDEKQEASERERTPDEGKKDAVQDTETPAAGELPSVSVKKKNGKRAAFVIGAAVLIAGCCFAVTHHSDGNNIKITCNGWTYIERTDGKDMTGTLHVGGKKNLALLTGSGKWILMKDGDCEVTENINSDEEDMQDPVSAIYELKNPEDTNLNIQVGKLSCELSDYSSIFLQYAQVKTTITADSEKPFLLFYHFEDAEGNIPEALMANAIPYQMITEKETSVSDSIWFIKDGDNTDFQFVVDGVVTFDLEEDPEADLGTASDKTDSYYTVTQPVTLPSEKSGLLLADVETDGKDRGLNCYKISDGEGSMSWGTAAENDSEVPDKVTFTPVYFVPSEFATDYVLDFTGSEKRAATLEEAAEKSKNLYRGTVTLAGDGSYLKIDTNPDDEEDGGYTDVLDVIEEANRMLGFKESLNEKMETTRAMDGKQNETAGNIQVTWSYHPDKGLEVMYEKTAE